MVPSVRLIQINDRRTPMIELEVRAPSLAALGQYLSQWEAPPSWVKFRKVAGEWILFARVEGEERRL
jgi:hypothetical protein